MGTPGKFDAAQAHPDDLRPLEDIAKFRFATELRLVLAGELGAAGIEERDAKRLIKTRVAATTKTRIVGPGTIERARGKAKRVMSLGAKT